ncbi:MAG: hypothetical protein M0P01_05010 [Treponema sp.]|nr:hypothetical protein [Treponema sp.]
MVIEHRITTLNEWLNCCPPKNPQLQWQDDYSAKEFAEKVLADDFERDIAQIAAAAGITGLKINNAYPEHITCLDNFPGGQRNHDLACTCRSDTGTVAVCFEAKAGENFGETLHNEWKKGDAKPKSKIQDRINAMFQLLWGKNYTPAYNTTNIGKIYYQLLTGLTGTIRFAHENSIQKCIFIIYQLKTKTVTNSKIQNHRNAISDFLKQFKLPDPLNVNDNSIYRLGFFDNIETWLGYMKRS